MRVTLLCIVIFLIASCCGDGEGDGYLVSNNYFRKIEVSDTNYKINKISYSKSNKVFYPNDTIADLLISDNTFTTLYIQTQNEIDTITLLVETKYEYIIKNNCHNEVIAKFTNLTPKIISHTFRKAIIESIRIEHNTERLIDNFDLLIITP